MSQRSSRKKIFYKRKSFFIFLGLIIGISISAALYETSVYFSTDESCMSCHVHPHADESWQMSSHMMNKSGTKVHCVDCHLPPTSNTVDHYSAKLKLGLKDVWSYLTKDSADHVWNRKSDLEYVYKMIPNESCKECHYNLFPEGLNDDGVTAHLYYEDNEEKLGLHCISCHLDVGHHDPNYVHGKLEGIPMGNQTPVDSSMYFKEATKITEFADFTEQIPNTPISFKMVAIQGGTFKMGSESSESFHKEDETPAHDVTLSNFYMAEVETTWDMYWAFYASTMSEGRTPPEVVFANNSNNPDVDGVSGPTAPFGFPDQGWGGGSRPAITMTHYAAETFCQWLSLKTGKKYRLPTEAEWEYAARGGRNTPYFFDGDPKDFSDFGFWRKFFSAKTEGISDYVIYGKNSQNKTQDPSMVKPNPFGLKNMLGNVYEYCADKYDPDTYKNRNGNVKNPLVTSGESWVIRGGNFASDASDLRCASRFQTDYDAWLKTDPQQPKSIWWLSDIKGIGFRIVCETDFSPILEQE